MLKQTPIDVWSLREQLGLASAVLRSGDQNWVSVSRQMKPFSEEGRPHDWFSQKNCALQYNLLLEKVDTPRRKRGDKMEATETPGQAIVRRLKVIIHVSVCLLNGAFIVFYSGKRQFLTADY